MSIFSCGRPWWSARIPTSRYLCSWKNFPLLQPCHHLYWRSLLQRLRHLCQPNKGVQAINRTLQRRLQAEETNYQQQLNQRALGSHPPHHHLIWVFPKSPSAGLSTPGPGNLLRHIDLLQFAPGRLAEIANRPASFDMGLDTVCY